MEWGQKKGANAPFFHGVITDSLGLLKKIKQDF